MSEIKKVTFYTRKWGNCPYFRMKCAANRITNNYKQLHSVFIASLGFLLLIADWGYYWFITSLVYWTDESHTTISYVPSVQQTL